MSDPLLRYEREWEQRVLVLAPSGVDAELVVDLLARERLSGRPCATVEALACGLEEGAGAAIIAEEALRGDAATALARALARQPDWSDVPLIVLTLEDRDADALVGYLRSAGSHLTVLERPIRSSTLLASVRASLASRARQYQVRDELERRRRAEQALRESEYRLRRAQRAGGVGVWEVDVATRRVVWSEAMWEIYGHPPDPGTDPAELFQRGVHPDDAAFLRAQVLRCLEGAQDQLQAEFRLTRPDGTHRWVQTAADVSRDDGGRPIGFAGVCIDVTERREVEEALRWKSAALEEEDRNKDLFLATLGHELRNPLAALDLELRLLEDGTADVDRIHTRMSVHVEQLTRLVNDLLEVSRITSGKLSLQKVSMDLTAVVRTAAEGVAADIRARKQELVLSLEEDLHVEGDPTRLSQVVSNLVANASRYTPERGRIEVGAHRDGSLAVVTVRDTGRGLRPDQLESIFEPFTQGDPFGGGLGIGLALVRGLVELHGGRVSAESDGPGLGARFTVRIPVGDVRALGAGPTRWSIEALPRSLRVLVIDDNRDLADSLVLLLDRMGAESRCSYTGTDGLEKAREWHPEAVLIDIGLPDMSGYEVAERIRVTAPEDRSLLVAVTGFGDVELEQRARRAGFDRILRKPLDTAKLDDLLRRRALADGAGAAASG